MKRLLAYLFIFLGLGLTFSVNTETKASSSSNLKKYCYVIHFNDSKLKIPRVFRIYEDLKNCKDKLEYKLKQYTYRDVDEFIYIWLSTKTNKNSVAAYNNLNSIYGLFSVRKISTSIVDRVVMDNKEKLSSYVPHLKSTQIAKAKPSQTQKVADKYLCIIDKLKEKPSDISIPINQLLKVVTLKSSQQSNCTLKFYKSKNKKLYSRIKLSSYVARSDMKNEVYNWYISYKAINKIFDEQKVQIARFVIDNSENLIVKKTTKKNLKKKIAYKFCVIKGQRWYWTSITLGKCEDNSEVSIEEFIKVRLTRVTGSEPDNRTVDQRFFEELDRLITEFKIYKISESIIYDSIDKDRLLTSINKNKSKVKVAKVEDSTQEEFKPKKTNQDNEAPVIEIAEAITVDSQAYTLKGKVKDKSQIYLTIDGRQVDVKKGKFEFPGFVIDPSEGEVLKIVAIDRWQNKSEKTINIKVEFKQTANSRSYEKPNPNNIRTKTDNDKIGIIIGIEKYQALSNLDAPYANRDANAFRAYATRALGIPNKNLKVLIDNEATRSGLLKSLKIWLPQMTRGKSKDIYIFFAGHGLASDDGKDLHILPQDGDPILLEDTALSRIEMFDLINKVSPKSVTMFFDTCYSGQTRSEQMLVAGLRPVRIVADEQDTPNNFTIFTASNYDQTSGSINEAEHGIFSYYLMKGLEGNADVNKDKELTNGELIAYLKSNVSQEAFTQNRSQEPMLAGDPDKILMSYR